MSRSTLKARVLKMRLELWLAGAVLGGVSCGGDETTGPAAPDEVEPVLLTAATPALAFYQVSGGGLHTCGITTANRMYCWGTNNHGQLGDGSKTTRLKPFPVAGTLRFRQVSAGDLHTCGVTTDYRAYCWGQNSGKLGDGTTTERLRPVAVAGGRRFRQGKSVG